MTVPVDGQSQALVQRDAGAIAKPFQLRNIRATPAGASGRKVQQLLGHAHITTTQIYDKRRITTKQSASHDVPI